MSTIWSFERLLLMAIAIVTRIRTVFADKGYGAEGSCGLYRASGTEPRLRKRLHANKEALLLVLDRPEVPLHTNGAERDLRPQVVKRTISGGTRSEAGRACRDAFLGLVQTCAKLGVSFWDYLGHRLGVRGAEAPYLPDLVRLRSAQA